MSKTWKITIGAISVVLLLFVGCVAIIAISNDAKNGETISQSPTSASLATPLQSKPTPTLAPLSDDALAMLSLYHELLEFKDESQFHSVCYGQAGPYSDWAKRGKDIDDRAGIGLAQETGIVFGELRQMGWDYCQNQGQETEYTQYVKSLMKPRWLAAQ